MSHNSYYQKEKIKGALDRMGLLKPVAIVSDIRGTMRHWKYSLMAYCRSHGFKDHRFETLRKYEGIYKGERCFVVCTGPSLTAQDVEALKDECTFSMNSIIKLFAETSWRPTYYVIEDKDVYISLENELMMYDLDNCFAADYLMDLINETQAKHKFIFYPLDHWNPCLKNINLSFEHGFSDNPYSVIYAGYTVTFSIIQMAVYMGFKEIYLLGCDCNYSGEKRHFKDYNAPLRYSAFTLEQKMKRAYQVAREYCDAHGIKIYNATRGGKLEVFERVDFDELMRQLK